MVFLQLLDLAPFFVFESVKTAGKMYLNQLMRLWYLSHRRPAKAQASLRIRAVSPEPSLFAHMKCGSRRKGRPNKQTSSPHWMAAHARLKNEFKEDGKYHNLMRWLICRCEM